MRNDDVIEKGAEKEGRKSLLTPRKYLALRLLGGVPCLATGAYLIGIACLAASLHRLDLNTGGCALVGIGLVLLGLGFIAPRLAGRAGEIFLDLLYFWI